MGYYTELLFNEIELTRGSLHRLRSSAIEARLDAKSLWSYMLDYIYVESSDYRTIDLEISKRMKQELKRLYRTAPVPFSKLGDAEATPNGDENGLSFTIQWYPYDGYSGKWRHVDEFVAWVSPFCTAGQLFEVTQEDGGGLWGWELSDGMFRQLELRPKGRWRKSKLLKHWRNSSHEHRD